MDTVFSPQTAGMTVVYKYKEENRNSNLHIQKGSNFSVDREYTILKCQKEYLIIFDSMKAKSWENKRI